MNSQNPKSKGFQLMQSPLDIGTWILKIILIALFIKPQQ